MQAGHQRLGSNQGDMDMLRDKLVWDRGYSIESADRIAGSIKAKLYGG